MKQIEKVSLLIILINLSIWINGYWEKLNTGSLIVGIISLLVAYVLLYVIVLGCMHSFARNLLKDAVEYLKKNHELKAIEFNGNFYDDISRQFGSYILIGLLLLDAFALFKLKFSVLSVINTFITGNNNE